MRRIAGTTTAIVISLALYFAAVVQVAAAETECTLEVEPSVAVAGSEFHLSGSGFTPTQLILQKDDGEPVTVELDLGEQDPFEIPIGSRKGDEGKWTATAVLPDVCEASVQFTATLENTDALEDIIATPTAAGRMSLLLVALVVGTGIVGGAVAARRLVRA